MDYLNYSVTEIIELLDKNIITSEELVKLCFDRIDKNKHLNSLNSLYMDYSLERAKYIDQKRKEGKKLGLLAGVPIIIKDNISMKDMFNTCSSNFLKEYKAIYNSTVVDKLIAQDAIIIAKANMDEFAMGSSNENSFMGNVLNPINNEYVPGGSSGGSAASVAAKLAFASLGTDTGGSVRQPASYCGVVGLKPTYGRVSRFGVVAFGSSFDQVGPITRTVKDSALMLQALAGYDVNDSTSSKQEVLKYSDNINKDMSKLRVGVCREFYSKIKDRKILDSIDNIIESLRKEGAKIIDIKLPNIDKSLPVYYILSSAEATSNLGRFDGVRYGTRSEDHSDLTDMYYKSRTQGFGKEVKRRIMMGNFVLSSGYKDAYYNKANKVRELIRRDFINAFIDCDVILTPTTPTVAFKHGEKINDVMEMYLNDIFTVAINVAGVPAISVPYGSSTDNMPIGIQVISNYFEESKLFCVGQKIEELNNKERS